MSAQSRSISQKIYRAKNIVKLLRYGKETRAELKREALQRYGQQCSRCGFNDIRALQIDHIDNDGCVERRALGGQQVSGWRFYHWLRSKGWPEGYQTLCANCNAIKHVIYRESAFRVQFVIHLHRARARAKLRVFSV